jgi:hypothetical protein
MAEEPQGFDMAEDPPSRPDDTWERSMLKGLGAFTQERGKAEPASLAPQPDTEDANEQPFATSDFTPFLTPDDSFAPPVPDPGRRDEAVNAMLSAFEPRSPGESPQPIFRSVSILEPPAAESYEPEPVPVDEPGQRKRALLSAIGKGLGGASRIATDLGSRTKEYLGSAGSNFVGPVVKQPNHQRKKTL